MRAMTTATRIDGKAKAAELSAAISAETATLLQEHDLKPGLAVVIIGDNPASQVYVRNKKRTAEACGFHSEQHTLADDVSQAEALKLIDDLNNDDAIHGILVQLPLPEQISANAILTAIDPAKDVDGFHVINTGLLATGQEGMVPCTPLGCLMLLKDRLGVLKGLNAVIVGRSNIVGKPLANMLIQKNPTGNATVTVCHTRTKDLSYHTKRADIVIAAAGRPNTVTADMVKEGVVVIDVGVNRVEDATKKRGYRLVGDVDFEAVKEKASLITPVPGGVGPMTITMLLYNTVESAKRATGIDVNK